MVWESWYWKQRLKSHAAEIELISEQPDASKLDISNLEISLFTGFFLVRKLMEAKTKLSKSLLWLPPVKQEVSDPLRE
ncbi:MAG: hypothetical protein CVT75_05765 [Alphaproteobacteria bacterium HGW-Alphaproteobacteria-14]|nr:MAG: hypothetical protein CVT75_05765 [Alphaproteobacteria bacterium HGW-Alphaproteobacteria-14]